MSNLDQELDSILEELHNSWIEDDYEFDDPNGVHAKQTIKAIITTQKQELLSEIEKELPLPKQTEFMLNKGMVTKTEEDMQRFYRYGGYDFALNQVKSIITTKRGELNGTTDKS